MKKFLFSAAVTLMATVMSACSADEPTGGEQPKTLEVTEGQIEQTTYADETEGTSGVTFVAPAPWTANVSENATRAGSVSWLRLKINGEEAYSGGAGTINLVIEMDENDTADDRNATITISSGGSDIEINVSQKAKTIAEAIADGEFESKDRPAPASGRVWKIIATYPDGQNYTKSLTIDYQNGRDIFVSSIAQKIVDNGAEFIEEYQTILDFENTTTYIGATTSYDGIEKISEGAQCTFASNGFLNLKASVIDYVDSRVTRNHEMGYDSNNQLVTFRDYYAMSDYISDRVVDIEWTNSNPTKVTEGTSGVSQLASNITMTYGALDNNAQCNVDFNMLMCLYQIFGGKFENNIFYGFDLLGKRSAKMVSKITKEYDDYVLSYDMGYTVNTAGFINKITITTNNPDNSHYMETLTVLYK